MSRSYCDAEQRAFDDAEFARADDGSRIHVITASEGHTTEGWPARYDATPTNAGWEVTNVRISLPDLEAADAEVGPDDDRA